MYARRTAFIRVWYRGPPARYQSSTSWSIRREIACFETGTTTASFQKSGGRSVSSRGDVAASSASDTVRRRSTSARPRLGCTGSTLCCIRVDLTFMAISPPGRDDAPIAVAVGVDNREVHPVRLTDCDHAFLAVVVPAILYLDGAAVEDQGTRTRIHGCDGWFRFCLCPTRTARKRIQKYIHIKQRPARVDFPDVIAA